MLDSSSCRVQAFARAVKGPGHIGRGGSSMLSYQFYCLDEKGEGHLIGILPERRFNSARINDRSVMNWAKEIIGSGCHGRRIHFVRVNMPEGDREIH
jgi:hypothetical protein